MDKNQALATIQNIFREVLDNPNLTISPSSSAKDVEGWDSLAHIGLVVAIEKQFGTRFALAELQVLKNVGDMIELLERKLRR